MTAMLAVDGGQTCFRIALVQRGRPVRDAVLPGFGYQTSNNGSFGAITVALIEAFALIGAPKEIARICLGLSGAPAKQDARRQLATSLSQQFSGAEVWLGPDMVTAHAGALSGEPGVVVAAGTGVVCLGLGLEGRVRRADGLGHIFGDEGSGFSIGRAAIRAAFRGLEGRGPKTSLTEAASRFFVGLDDLPERIQLSTNPVRDVAGFAPEVAREAAEGDPTAQQIWDEAVDHLVRTAMAVVRGTFPAASPRSVPVSYVGGLFASAELLLTPFRRRLMELCEAADCREPQGDALAGAVWLLSKGPGRYAQLLEMTGAGNHE